MVVVCLVWWQLKTSANPKKDEGEGEDDASTADTEEKEEQK
jgi:hypothetical protein